MTWTASAGPLTLLDTAGTRGGNGGIDRVGQGAVPQPGLGGGQGGAQGWAPVSHAAAMLRIGSEVAAQRKARPPADYLAQAGAELAAAGVLADPLSFIAQVRAHLHEEDDGEASADV